MTINTRDLKVEANSLRKVIDCAQKNIETSLNSKDFTHQNNSQIDRDQLAFDIPGLIVGLKSSPPSKDQLALDLSSLISDPLRYSPKIKELLPQKRHSYNLSQVLLFGSSRQAKTGYMMSQCAHRVIEVSSRINTTYCRSRWCDICAVKSGVFVEGAL